MTLNSQMSTGKTKEQRMSGAQMWETLAEKLQTLRRGCGMTNNANKGIEK